MKFCRAALGLLLIALLTRPAWSDVAKSGADFDLQGFINAELRAGKSRIVVPPGRYRVTPKERQHLVFRDLHDIEIEADGVEMICTETTRAVTIAHCRNFTLRGLTIDYDPLPFTQGRIVGMSADKSVHEIELCAGYPPAESARNFKYEIFRPDTRTLRGDDRYPARVEVLGPRRLQVIMPSGKATNPEQIGDLIVVGAETAPHGSAGHAVECDGNVDMRLENITLYASNCFGFLEVNCSGSKYYRCKIDRRPSADEPLPRTEPRLRSLNADAYHSKHALKGPAYIECSARYMGDDGINICGDYQMIMASHGRQLRVLAKHAMNIRPGDPVELVQYNGLRLPDARAAAVEPAGNILADEKEFLSRQRMDENLRTARGGMLGTAYRITLDRDVEMPRGGVISAANRVGSGFVVRGCQFGQNRSRGILIKGSHGEVAGNRLEACRMAAVLVAPEYWWLEAGSSNDVKIVGNTIVDCGGTAICVDARAGNGEIAPAGAHHDITIRGNRASHCANPWIRVASTRGLTIEDNVIAEPSERQAGEVEMIHCGK